ncbi:hypothetical protein AB0R12_30480, partial [Streptomyces niveus]
SLARTFLVGTPHPYPRIAALADDLVSGTPGQRLRWMFDMVVNGALATPRTHTSDEGAAS